MKDELVDLIVTLDSREKEQKRINSMRSFFEERGAIVEVGAITIKDGGQVTSVDYSIEGSYKGKPVNVGFSAKSIIDFSATIGNLSNELARGYLRFEEVGFILITGCYQTTLSNDGLHAVVRNPAVQDGSADILNTTSMFNALSSWERSGIHCRQILYEEQFPQAVISILNFITKDNHEGIGFNTKGVTNPEQKAKMDFVNAHIHFGVQGVGVKTALKLWDYIIELNYPPNLHFAASLSEEDLIDALGTKTGKALYEAYRNRHGWIDVKKSSEEANRSPPERKPPEPKGNIPTIEESCLKSPLNQSDSKIITDGNKIQNDVLILIESHPKGINYTDVVRSFKQNESDVYDIIHLLMQEGKCYEPRIGLLVPINPSLQSSSAEQAQSTSNSEDLQTSGKPEISNMEATHSKLGTLDNLQSSEVSHTPIASVDPLPKDVVQFHDTKSTLDNETAEGTILSHIPTCIPSAVLSTHKEVVESLEDAIADRVYDKPETDTVIMREFMSRGFQMPEIHKVIKESSKLHKYKQGGNLMIAYKGVSADEEMDVGV